MLKDEYKMFRCHHHHWHHKYNSDAYGFAVCWVVLSDNRNYSCPGCFSLSAILFPLISEIVLLTTDPDIAFPFIRIPKLTTDEAEANASGFELEEVGIVDGKSRVLGVVLSSLKLWKRYQLEWVIDFSNTAFPGNMAVLASNYPTNRMNLQPGGKQLVIDESIVAWGGM